MIILYQLCLLFYYASFLRLQFDFFCHCSGYDPIFFTSYLLNKAKFLNFLDTREIEERNTLQPELERESQEQIQIFICWLMLWEWDVAENIWNMYVWRNWEEGIVGG